MTKLFVYGIFTDEEIRKRAFGSEVKHEKAALNGYALADELVLGLYQNIVEKPTDFVEGMLLDIPEEYLEITDRIEGVEMGLYKRIQVGDWWVYIH